MPEPLIPAGAMLVAFAAALPLRSAPRGRPGRRRRARRRLLRHRVALETLRDVEADRRAGSLDDATYAEQLAAAEARAAITRAALDDPQRRPACRRRAAPARRRGRSSARAAAAVIGALLVVGSALPATGIANGVVAELRPPVAEAAESARRDRIDELLGRPPPTLATRPRCRRWQTNTSGRVERGGPRRSGRRAAGIDRDRARPRRRVRADHRCVSPRRRPKNARSVPTSYEALEAADPVEVAFFDGLIALREGESAAAAAPSIASSSSFDDPRASMVRGLRDEAEANDRRLLRRDAPEHPPRARRGHRQRADRGSAWRRHAVVGGPAEPVLPGVGQRRPLPAAVGFADHGVDCTLRHEAVDRARHPSARGGADPRARSREADANAAASRIEDAALGRSRVLLGLELALELAGLPRGVGLQEGAPRGEAAIVARDAARGRGSGCIGAGHHPRIWLRGQPC